MRDMLASLSEVKDLNKIEMLRSVISIAMTRVGECAEFIISYAKHGFWGELSRCLLIDRSHRLSQAASLVNRCQATLRIQFSCSNKHSAS
jgi:hypothetical protein